ncbi:MAG: DUF1572 family protein [Bacteroidia bacterium]|nr:DUF1572 family protein [Bacteroidia bacterium]HQV00444.1 DUF1572 family protein [Bacteroidia bacterium]
MVKQTIVEFLERDLNTLKLEIEKYKSDDDLWKVADGISNCAGNLCLHLCGNLKHYIGALLGHTGYIRHRDAEFDLKDIPAHALIADIDITKNIVTETLQKLSDADLLKTFPDLKHGKSVTALHMLLHLMLHFQYHLGQINYHRRILGS